MICENKEWEAKWPGDIKQSFTKMLNSANMYPWYRDSMSQLGQFCSGNNLPAPTAAHIKTENGYNDCMLALEYAQNKVRKKNLSKSLRKLEFSWEKNYYILKQK